MTTAPQPAPGNQAIRELHTMIDSLLGDDDRHPQLNDPDLAQGILTRARDPHATRLLAWPVYRRILIALGIPEDDRKFRQCRLLYAVARSAQIRGRHLHHEAPPDVLNTVERIAIDRMPPELAKIRSEQHFMNHLRMLRTRTGLSYRELARRMRQFDSSAAVGKSTLQILFSKDTIPTNSGQLRALLSVLVSSTDGSPPLILKQYMHVYDRLRTGKDSITTQRADSNAGDIDETPDVTPLPEPALNLPNSPAPQPAILLLLVVAGLILVARGIIGLLRRLIHTGRAPQCRAGHNR